MTTASHIDKRRIDMIDFVFIKDFPYLLLGFWGIAGYHEGSKNCFEVLVRHFAAVVKSVFLAWWHDCLFREGLIEKR